VRGSIPGGGVGALNVVHRDPQVPVLGTSIEYPHDARVVQPCHDIGFPFEAAGQFRVGGHFPVQQLQRDLARQSGMLCEVDRPHPASAQDPLDLVSGEDRTHPQHPCSLRHHANVRRYRTELFGPPDAPAVPESATRLDGRHLQLPQRPCP
jgi:hypothetical protein